ncbi:asparaginase [Aquisalinus flavus]|uniref:Asparaginase n=1 Tax=Aquisalinus flavus TaxID=1526572 RepID=A0A8J2V2T5_9PROT|nr:asparaginase [Aquisalinus flavus]MBD0425656.1 asparaginase [Aquisalinus flavus]UNE48729.1 asparaginase [Aquisalinus flavus]GGD14284.1 asparaginase [Aquisalinus flavus]
MKPVRILVTGGTIDKVHDPYTEALAFAADGSTQIPEILHYGRCHFPVTQVAMMLDSLNMTDDHREMLAQTIRAATEDALVVTHGTSTMGDTARYLDTALKGQPKTVVLTGAMRPFSLFHSDGPFNLGGAIIAAQCLPAGVHGVMNGRVFVAGNLKKNTDLGRFDV